VKLKRPAAPAIFGGLCCSLRHRPLPCLPRHRRRRTSYVHLSGALIHLSMHSSHSNYGETMQWAPPSYTLPSSPTIPPLASPPTSLMSLLVIAERKDLAALACHGSPLPRHNHGLLLVVIAFDCVIEVQYQNESSVPLHGSECRFDHG
jgi:hypothetical protein